MIIFSITIIVAFVWLALGMVIAPTNAIHNQLVQLNALEDQVSYQLLEMKLNAEYYELSSGEAAYVQAYQEADAKLKSALVEVNDARESNLRASLLAALDAHRQAFADLQAAVQAGDDQATEAARSALRTATARAQQTITDWTYQIGIRRNESMLLQEARLWLAVAGGGAGLALLPLLAFWAFGLAGQSTRPILALTDFVVAISSEHIHPELPLELLARNDNLGQLARDVEGMSHKIHARRQALAAELAALRDQLKEDRRRKRT